MRNRGHMRASSLTGNASRDRKGAVSARRIFPPRQATSFFRLAFLAAAVVSAAAAATVVKPSTLKVIPQPVSVQLRPGFFHLRPGMAIVVTTGKPEARQVGAYLANAVAAPTGWKWKISETAKPSGGQDAIALELTKGGGVAGDPHPEGYNLTIDRKSTRLNSSHLGISYAVF